MCNIRTICDPEDNLESGFHSHLCPNCSTCWKHNRDELDELSSVEFRKAHECPNCGEDVRAIHKNNKVRLFCDCVPFEGFDFSNTNPEDFPTFALATLQVIYKLGFEVKTFEAKLITTDANLKNEAWVKSKSGEILRKHCLEYDKLLGAEVEALLIPPPENAEQIKECILSEGGIVMEQR